MRSRRRARPPRSSLALPARYALVEVVNNHDDALQFEPIHRVLFGVDHEKFMNAFRAAYPNAYEGKGDGHTIEYTCGMARATSSPFPIPRYSWLSAPCRASSTRI